MTSPFKTFEEFNTAEGPIYTFANNPAMISFLLVITALILLFFIYKSYTMRQGTHSNPASLALLLASALSLAGISQGQAAKQAPEASRRQTATEMTTKSLPALLGMIGIGAVAKSNRRKSRFRSSAPSGQLAAKLAAKYSNRRKF